MILFTINLINRYRNVNIGIVKKSIISITDKMKFNSKMKWFSWLACNSMMLLFMTVFQMMHTFPTIKYRATSNPFIFLSVCIPCRLMLLLHHNIASRTIQPNSFICDENMLSFLTWSIEINWLLLHRCYSLALFSL
jgi:hypothetical protein